MSETVSRFNRALPDGRKRTHGGYSFLKTGKLPIHQREIERYLTGARASLVIDLGGTEENLTAAQIILIDRVISMLGVVRCIEEYIRENSVMVGHNIAPALQSSYLGYNNAIARTLDKLGINERVVDAVADPLTIIKESDEEKAGGG